MWNIFENIADLGLCTKINYCLRGQKTRWYYVFNLLSYERTSRVLGYEKQWLFWEKMEPNWVDFKHFLMYLVLDAASRLGWGAGGSAPLLTRSTLGKCSCLWLCSEHGHFSRLLSWKWQRKMVAIIGFKVLGGESCHFINSSPYTLFPCCEII